MEAISMLPDRIRGLHKFVHNGKLMPVPHFVAWRRGDQSDLPVKPGEAGAVPLFQTIDTAKRDRSIQAQLCWICGVKLGRLVAFAGGPQIGINGISVHGAMHVECARFCVSHFPFLFFSETTGKERPGEKVLRERTSVLLLWHCREFSILEAGGTRRLFLLTQPHMVEWFCEGRAATRAEVESSIRTIIPGLLDIAARTKQIKQMREAVESFIKTYLPEN